MIIWWYWPYQIVEIYLAYFMEMLQEAKMCNHERKDWQRFMMTAFTFSIFLKAPRLSCPSPPSSYSVTATHSCWNCSHGLTQRYYLVRAVSDILFGFYPLTESCWATSALSPFAAVLWYQPTLFPIKHSSQLVIRLSHPSLSRSFAFPKLIPQMFILSNRLTRYYHYYLVDCSGLNW